MTVMGLIAARLRNRAPRLMASLERELPLRSVANLYTPAAPARHAIPNVMYQTWQDARLGRSHRAALTRMREANPDYGFELFDDAALDRFMAETYGDTPIVRIFRAARFGPLRTDIWRYCILHERGGVYCDIGKGFDAPLRTLWPAQASGVIAFERNQFVPDEATVPPPGLLHPDRRVVNWALAFAPGHPLLRRVIDGIVAKYPLYKGKVSADPKLDILKFTGPIHLTECVHAHARANGVADLHQAGIDFEGHGRPSLPGSYVRYLSIPSYMHARHAPIVL
jgi:mannosyltransferase OCH1-like enzyme